MPLAVMDYWLEAAAAEVAAEAAAEVAAAEVVVEAEGVAAEANTDSAQLTLGISNLDG